MGGRKVNGLALLPGRMSQLTHKQAPTNAAPCLRSSGAHSSKQQHKRTLSPSPSDQRPHQTHWQQQQQQVGRQAGIRSFSRWGCERPLGQKEPVEGRRKFESKIIIRLCSVPGMRLRKDLLHLALEGRAVKGMQGSRMI